MTQLHFKYYDLAIADLTKAIELEPNDPNLYLERSIIYRSMGDKKAEKADLKMSKSLKKKR